MKFRTSFMVALLPLVFGAASAPAWGHSEHANHASHDAHAKHGAAAVQAPETVRLAFKDTALTDQHGKVVKFKTDVLGDRLVIMDFVYTSCTTVCPVVSAVLGQVQESLGARLGKEVQLVSITVDPQRDTPARLKAYSAKHGARVGWSWLTGSPANVAEVLKATGTYTPNFEDHPVVILVGDPKTGQWVRHYGFADPKDLLKQVDVLAAARRTGVPSTARKE